ncbi:hypothetical protein Osc7112_0118 [Oscillatoria nigro-viridis PCC 7112]|uniref:Uncharacterized protein n=1 Tax=Phormidium nigroviride PCC 7112 TaxID=179408 RepID=K9VBY9_9CYAN|nr:hypothetical protein Osc7112_0118 [Oscillatoria nigro-viridis PCC 7112]
MTVFPLVPINSQHLLELVANFTAPGMTITLSKGVDNFFFINKT